MPGTPANRAVTVGHGGVGIVEAIGPQASRVEVGDRVIVNFGPLERVEWRGKQAQSA